MKLIIAGGNDYEFAEIGKLLVGTPMLVVFVAMWAGVRHGIDLLQHRKQAS